VRKRYLYSLLFGIPGLIVSALIAFFVFATVSGFLWLYVSGDSEPLSHADTMLMALFVAVLVVTWGGFIVTGFVVGKSLEKDPGQNRQHVAISIVATLVPLAVIALHQLSVGNLGAKSDSVICGEYCRSYGYEVSAMPAKSAGEAVCQCLDLNGREAMSVHLDRIRQNKP
jgi:hypothetical protein